MQIPIQIPIQQNRLWLRPEKCSVDTHGLVAEKPPVDTHGLVAAMPACAKAYKNKLNWQIWPSGVLQRDPKLTLNINIDKEFKSFLNQCNFTIWDVGRRRILDLQDAIFRFSFLSIKHMKYQQKLPFGGLLSAETRHFALVL